MSRSLATNCGSFESLNCRIRCGCRPCARQMRCTELTLIAGGLGHRRGRPVRRLARRVVQRQRDHALGHLGLERRDARGPGLVAQQPIDAFRDEPLLPAPDAGLATCRSRRMISSVPTPSALSSTIRARHTCFWGALRSLTQKRAAARDSATVRRRKCAGPHAADSHARKSARNPYRDSKCQTRSTSFLGAIIAAIASRYRSSLGSHRGHSDRNGRHAWR